MNPIKITLVVMLVLGASACAVRPTNPTALKLQQQTEWYSSSHLQGCLLGAALSGGVCAAVGGGTGTCIASAAAGCALGLGAAEYMAQKRQQYANQEQMLQSVIGDVRLDNHRLKESLMTQQQLIREDLARLAAIEQSYAQKKISLEEAQKQVQTLRNDRDLLQTQANDMQKLQTTWEERNAVANDPRIAQEVQTLNQQISSAKQDIDTFTNQLNMSTIGGGTVQSQSNLQEPEKISSESIALQYPLYGKLEQKSAWFDCQSNKNCDLIPAQDYIAKKRQQYPRTSRMQKAISADIARDNQQLTDYVAIEQELIAICRQKIAQLQKDYRPIAEKQTLSQQLNHILSRLEHKRSCLNHLASNWNARSTLINNVVITKKLQSLASTINKAHQNVDDYKREFDAFSQAL